MSSLASYVQSGRQYAVLAVTEPTDVRKNFHILSGIVNNCVSADLRNSDVFIFVNKNSNRIKVLRKDPRGLVIYAMMLDYGRLCLPSVEQGALRW